MTIMLHQSVVKCRQPMPLYFGRYCSITFVKEGTYDLPGGGTVTLAGRVVTRLQVEAVRNAA
jgi:hypothetical protein